MTLDLKGEQPYKIDRVDTWNMKVIPVGTAQPGEYTFAAPDGGSAYRFTTVRHRVRNFVRRRKRPPMCFKATHRLQWISQRQGI